MAEPTGGPQDTQGIVGCVPDLDRGPLSVNQTRELRAACRSNAQRLISDAGVLLERGSFPGVCNLAYFALEELAKARALLLLECQLLDGDAIAWQEFWDGWESHRVKSVSALATEAIDRRMVETRVLTMLSAPAANQLGSKAKEIRETRKNALYVDWNGEEVVAPNEIVNQTQAADLLQRARSREDVHGSLEALLVADPTKARELLLHKIELRTTRQET